MCPQSISSRRCKVILVAIVRGIVNCARHCELCAALCAHNDRKRLWSDHRGYVTIENRDDLTHKGRYRAARAAKNRNTNFETEKCKQKSSQQKKLKKTE